jgi:hypothetical protein
VATMMHDDNDGMMAIIMFMMMMAFEDDACWWRWAELFPTKSTNAVETASVMLNHIGRFGSPDVIHTDQGPAFHNESLVRPLIH